MDFGKKKLKMINMAQNQVDSILKKAYISQVVKQEWHANKWFKTLLQRDQEGVGMEWFRGSSLVSRMWTPGDIMRCLRLTRTPLTKIEEVFSRIEPKIDELVKPVFTKEYLDQFVEYWNYGGPSKPGTLLIMMSFIIGVYYSYSLIPLSFHEVDPTLVFQPEKVEVLKKVILHKNPLIPEGSIFNDMGKEFKQDSLELTSEERANGLIKAIAIGFTTALIGIMLQSITTGDLDMEVNLDLTKI
jgi:hypothetical protein